MNKKILFGSVGVYAIWYGANPFFLPSRYPVETSTGQTISVSAVQWTEWLFNNGATGADFRKWLEYAHPQMIPLYFGLALTAIAAPAFPRLFVWAQGKIREQQYESRRKKERRSRPAQQERELDSPPEKPASVSDADEEESKVPPLPTVFSPEPIVAGVDLSTIGIRVDNPFGAQKLEDRWESSTEAERQVPTFVKIIQSRSDNFWAAPPPDPQKILSMVPDFPNFEEVLNFMAGYCAAGRLGSLGYLVFPPVLFVGPPGIGKTEFSRRLSDVLHVPVENIGLGGNSGGAMVLGGMNSGWRGSSPGRVAVSLATRGIVNPIFFLDEIDKVPTDATSVSSITSYLLPALEKSAKSLMDEFLGPTVTFDASRVLWISAANELGPIPEALKSRFTVFSIKNIPPEKMKGVIKSITTQTVRDLGLKDIVSVQFEDGGIKILSSLTPREINKTMRTLILEDVRISEKNGAGGKISVRITQKRLEKTTV